MASSYTSRGQCQAATEQPTAGGSPLVRKITPDPTSWILSVGGSTVHVELVISDQAPSMGGCVGIFLHSDVMMGRALRGSLQESVFSR